MSGSESTGVWQILSQPDGVPQPSRASHVSCGSQMKWKGIWMSGYMVDQSPLAQMAPTCAPGAPLEPFWPFDWIHRALAR